MSETAAPRSQTDVVIDGIKRMILDGALIAGGRLPVEKELAESLGVSRGSLREGVRALSQMGILDTRQGAGTYVTSLDPALLVAPLSFIVDLQNPEDELDIHRVRRFLESQAAQLAAVSMTAAGFAAAHRALEEMEAAIHADPLDHAEVLRSDMAFHRAIADGSGNRLLAELISALTSSTVRGRLLRAHDERKAERAALREHRAILSALEDREPERAALRMANHLLDVEDFLRSTRGVPTDPSADDG